jgi:hypothetical protein
MTITWNVYPNSDQQLIDHTLWRLSPCVLGLSGSHATLAFQQYTAQPLQMQSYFQDRTQMVKIQGN